MAEASFDDVAELPECRGREDASLSATVYDGPNLQVMDFSVIEQSDDGRTVEGDQSSNQFSASHSSSLEESIPPSLTIPTAFGFG